MIGVVMVNFGVGVVVVVGVVRFRLMPLGDLTVGVLTLIVMVPVANGKKKNLEIIIWTTCINPSNEIRILESDLVLGHVPILMSWKFTMFVLVPDHHILVLPIHLQVLLQVHPQACRRLPRLQ